MMRVTTDIAPSWRLVHRLLIPLGILATMPAKIISEIPFPIPLSLICSPSHMRKAVPAVSTSIITMTENTLSSTMASLNSPMVSPTACINPSTTVIYLVICTIFLRPSVPSCASRWKYGNAIDSRFTTIDAVIYGVMLSANIVKLLKAPPEKRSNRSNSPASLVNICDRMSRLMLGTGMLDPIRKMMSIIRVNNIFDLISATFQA